MSRDPLHARPVLTHTGRTGVGGGPGHGGRRASGWLSLDLGLFIAAAGLSLVGVLLIWSATRNDHGSQVAVRQLVSVAVAMVAAVVVSRLDVRVLRALAPAIHVLAVLGLAAVVSPLGTTVNGSRSWIRLPGDFSLQPSEFAKVALVIGLAMLLAERADRGVHQRHRDVALAWAVAAVPIALVLLQPDLGSALVLVAIAVVVIASAGSPRIWTLGVVVAGVAGVTAMFTLPVLPGYQRDRLLAFLDPSLDPQGIGYQMRQVRIAVGTGGLGGQGLFEGRQTQGGYIPFQETDFIFSVAAEELGFLGAAGLILLIAFVVVRAVLVARRADAFGRLLALGVAVWFGVQSFESIGMALGLTPVTGLPLPFVSYGGSSMIASWIALGLVGNVSAEAARRRLVVAR